MSKIYMRIPYANWVLCALGVLWITALAASAQEVYFPPGTLGPILQPWFSAELHVLAEPSLMERSEHAEFESFRFLWLRTFNEPIAVRLDIMSDGTGIITTKVATGEAGFPNTSTRLKTNINSPVTREQVQSFLRRVNELGFWLVPTTFKGDQTGNDGSEWIIEGLKDGKYHVVERWCADDSLNKRVTHQLGLILTFELAQLKIPQKEVY